MAVSAEGAADAAPILDRVLLAGDDLDCDLAIAGRSKPGERLDDLGFAAGDRRGADEVGGHKTALFRLDEHQVAAMVFEIMRALRPEAACGLDIGGDRV